MKAKILAIICGFVIVLFSNHGLAQPFDAERMRRAIISGNWTEVDAAVEEWLRNPTGRAVASIIRGYAALAKGDETAAVAYFLRANMGKTDPRTAKWFDELATKNPNSAMAQFFAGDFAARQNDRAGAIARLDKAVKLNPELHVAMLARAMLRVSGSEGHLALADLEALEKTALAADALVIRSSLDLDNGYLARAQDHLNRALQLAPGHAVALNTLGLLRVHQNNLREAKDAFAAAFGRAPELTEARTNYQITEAAMKHGSVIATKKITIVVANDEQMKEATGFAGDVLRARSGRDPIVTRDVNQAAALAGKYDVILQVPDGGAKSVLGGRVLDTLNKVNELTKGNSSVNIISQSHEASQNAVSGVSRFTSGPSNGNRTRVEGIQMMDPSELSGLVGKTPMGVTDNQGLARDSARLIKERNIPVTPYITEKIGIQHLNNGKAFKDYGVPYYSTPSEVKLELTPRLSLTKKEPTFGVGLKDAGDRGGERIGMSERDWTLHGSVDRLSRGSMSDLLTKNFGRGVNIASLPDLSSRQSTCACDSGGIELALMDFTRGKGGTIRYNKGSGKLTVVYTLFNYESLTQIAVAKR
ncbi:MAG: hypothetical protein FJ145_15760 [Deltaproteobacteria bacterium]|nr:hypothetical protein [Deltaproteobacteria bacterium]